MAKVVDQMRVLPILMVWAIALVQGLSLCHAGVGRVGRCDGEGPASVADVASAIDFGEIRVHVSRVVSLTCMGESDCDCCAGKAAACGHERALRVGGGRLVSLVHDLDVVTGEVPPGLGWKCRGGLAGRGVGQSGGDVGVLGTVPDVGRGLPLLH